MGAYNISVRTSNALSQQFVSIIVSVQYPVTKATVTVANAILDSKSQISILVTGSTNVAMEIAFGEVETIRLEASDLEQYLKVTLSRNGPH